MAACRDTLVKAAVRRQNSVNVGCGLRRAQATGGGRDGRPRESRILRVTTGSSMAARMRIREWQRGHSAHCAYLAYPPEVGEWTRPSSKFAGQLIYLYCVVDGREHG